jgi:hypothetical protein
MTMKTLTEAQREAIATADAHANNTGLPSYSELLAAHEYRIAEEKRKEEAIAHALENCESGAQSIAAMVAALECDYDRLEELRDERESHEFSESGEAEDMASGTDASRAAWVAEYPDEAEELAELEETAGDCKDADEAREAIQEDPLSIEVRSGWSTPGGEMEAEEFQILLTTGGPALRIVGELDQYKQPCRAWLEYQDWFTPWTEYHGDGVSNDDLLTYCQQFYFGE